MEKITKFYIAPAALEKWLHQNDADYIGLYIEGSLLDNFVVQTRRGFAAIYEHYMNSNQSNYYIEFQAGPAQAVLSNWYDFEDRAALDDAV